MPLLRRFTTDAFEAKDMFSRIAKDQRVTDMVTNVPKESYMFFNDDGAHVDAWMEPYDGSAHLTLFGRDVGVFPSGSDDLPTTFGWITSPHSAVHGPSKPRMCCMCGEPTRKKCGNRNCMHQTCGKCLRYRMPGFMRQTCVCCTNDRHPRYRLLGSCGHDEVLSSVFGDGSPTELGVDNVQTRRRQEEYEVRDEKERDARIKPLAWCDFCGKRFVRRRYCAGCKRRGVKTYYCDIECQRAAWGLPPKHRCGKKCDPTPKACE